VWAARTPTARRHRWRRNPVAHNARVVGPKYQARCGQTRARAQSRRVWSTPAAVPLGWSSPSATPRAIAASKLGLSPPRAAIPRGQQPQRAPFYVVARSRQSSPRLRTFSAGGLSCPRAAKSLAICRVVCGSTDQLSVSCGRGTSDEHVFLSHARQQDFTILLWKRLSIRRLIRSKDRSWDSLPLALSFSHQRCNLIFSPLFSSLLSERTRAPRRRLLYLQVAAASSTR
jgi:hypothetical protein